MSHPSHIHRSWWQDHSTCLPNQYNSTSLILLHLRVGRGTSHTVQRPI
uniref:Uncharacterized protein n=1 Tax=Arundo donax TaxID=35708 RepID=A0A0A8Z203_ARUDO